MTETVLAEIQELLLWQELNKQLIKVHIAEQPVPDHYHRYLQNFCFDNHLFSQLKSNPLIDEIPLSLISNFRDTSFITLKLQQWDDLVSGAIAEAHTLDIEDALDKSFSTLSAYDRKYNLTSNDDKREEDDEELHAFIQQYNTLRDSQGRDIARLVNELHRYKVDAVADIAKALDRDLMPDRRDDIILWEVGDDSGGKVQSLYMEKFCMPGLSLLENVIFPLYELDLHSFLHEKQTEADLKNSIREFLEHEISICVKETEIINKFIFEARRRKSNADLKIIPICSISPFYFLDYPFPLI